ncbi:hypothetical protein ACJJTC_005725 [Scirpophaga incertulas]
MKTIILLSTLIITSSCEDINQLFDKINKEYKDLKALGAELAWQTSLNPQNSDLTDRTANYQKKLILWQQKTCKTLQELPTRQLLQAQKRQIYLLCRGPQFKYSEARALSSLYDELQTDYANIAICLPVKKNKTKDSHEIEDAILDYLTDVTQIQNGGHSMPYLGENKDDTFCLVGENDVEKIMESSRNSILLKWLWIMWRDKLASMKIPYRQLVALENQASRRNGYRDVGAVWREELEIPELRKQCRRLYADIQPLYTLLHGVTRFYLRQHYGNIVPKRGPIPAHLLGNLWSQNWESLLPLISSKSIDLDKSIADHNWSVEHMVKRVEDFYQSLGLPAMTEAFWRESVFENKNGTVRCHGTAADMFKDGDYRLIYCAEASMQDFYVLHHEFGHIQYFMAYADQPGLFRQANAAFHESIGDAVMNGVMTPQHLNRLGLVNDTVLFVNNLQLADDTHSKRARDNVINKLMYFNLRDEDSATIINFHDIFGRKKIHNPFMNQVDTNKNNLDRTAIENNYKYLFDTVPEIENDNFEEHNNDLEIEDITADEILLLRHALNKIPQIPFALVIDEYRWKYFEDSIDPMNLNKAFWDLTLKLQGVAPDERRGEQYFDIAAKFHVPDNTPFIRYFLSSFIQHQIFEALCQASVFGNRYLSAKVPDSISLHRCDIYGSKAAGKLLRDFMSRGNSQHWRQILESTTGNTDITATALKRYYRPLYKLLTKIVDKHKIPLGW